MSNHHDHTALRRVRQGERGAALITTLLMSTLLFAAGGALVFSTMMSATNTAGATPEQQAYYASEAGLQAALNALRGNITPNPALSGGRRLTFRTAITPADSNNTDGGDNGAVARLSRYLPYTNFADPNSRVNLTGNGALAYSVRIEEPPGVVTPVANEPNMLLVTSTGFGPRGARKRLQMMVRRSNLDLDPPATLTLAGGAAITLDLGNSANVTYQGGSGKPAIAVSPPNAGATQTEMNNLKEPAVPGTVGQLGINATAPVFLQSPDNSRAFLNNIKGLADTQGRLFSSQGAVTDGMGTLTEPKVTVIDNYNGSAVSLGPGYQGNGILVVTGDLQTRGNTSFDGIILVLGKGNMDRSGGGNGEILGSIIVACFDPVDANADTYCNPAFSISGGGNSLVQYDQAKIDQALRATGRGVLGVVEN